jgi:hypothetical protein
MAIPRFQDGSSHLCWLRTMLFWPWWTSFDLYWLHVGFYGPNNYFVEPFLPCFEVVQWRENEAAQYDGRARWSLGAKTSSWEQNPNFDLVWTSRTVVVRETLEATHTTCWSNSSPAGCTPIRITVTLSDLSDHLSLLPSRSMSCFIDGLVRGSLCLSWLFFLL